MPREELLASNEWQSSQDALARCAAAPALKLESGKA
jgi:hypothetical protein